MKQQDIGYVRVQVGDRTLLSAAYRELDKAIDAGLVVVSPAGMQRLRQLISDIDDLSDLRGTSRALSSSMWELAR